MPVWTLGDLHGASIGLGQLVVLKRLVAMSTGCIHSHSAFVTFIGRHGIPPKMSPRDAPTNPNMKPEAGDPPNPWCEPEGTCYPRNGELSHSRILRSPVTEGCTQLVFGCASRTGDSRLRRLAIRAGTRLAWLAYRVWRTGWTIPIGASRTDATLGRWAGCSSGIPQAPLGPGAHLIGAHAGQACLTYGTLRTHWAPDVLTRKGFTGRFRLLVDDNRYRSAPSRWRVRWHRCPPTRRKPQHTQPKNKGFHHSHTIPELTATVR